MGKVKFYIILVITNNKQVIKIYIFIVLLLIKT